MSALADSLSEQTDARKTLREFFSDNARRMWGLPRSEPPRNSININVADPKPKTGKPIPAPLAPPSTNTPGLLQRWGLPVLASLGVAGGAVSIWQALADDPTSIGKRSILQVIEDAGEHLP